ncbi:uncharacterized protein RCO7_14809 [Rhynchosporium graminicola]|uniref:Uncharacterized protein n=1 Tax=Rhynchosporium graminicola TaxID=2792576 RepID=A0A1E1L3W1_9HELO|nr:uncharacterized protein RCO7_14809 [Rhynchosporium commune]
MDPIEDLEKPLMGGGSQNRSMSFHPPTCEYERGLRSWSKWHPYFRIALLLIIFMAWTSVVVLYSRFQSTSPFALVDRGNCGWTVEEAKANDCVYDIMLSSWIPKPCYDKELSESFLRANNFTYWTYNNGSGEVSEEELSLEIADEGTEVECEDFGLDIKKPGTYSPLSEASGHRPLRAPCMAAQVEDRNAYTRQATNAVMLGRVGQCNESHTL